MPITSEPVKDSVMPVAYTPILLGATDNPTVTYTMQVGKYILTGKLCKFTINIATSNIAKSTLTDALRVSLPFPAAAGTGYVQISLAQAQNSVPVRSANMAYINPLDGFLTFAQQTTTAGVLDLTYSLLSGIGILSNPITIRANGVYEVA